MADITTDKRVIALMKRRSNLIKDVHNWRNIWQQVSDYIVTQRADVTTKRSPGIVTTDLVHDSTAPTSALIAAAAAQGAMMPRTIRWFATTFTRQQRPLLDLVGVRDWLFELTVSMHESLNGGNFHAESIETWLDLFAYNTGCLFSEFRDGRVSYTSIQPGTYVVDENADGLVETMFRDFTLTTRDAVAEYGLDKMATKVREKLSRDGNSADDNLQLVHAVFRRNTVVDNAQMLRTSMSMPFAAFTIDVKNKHIVRESGFEEFPYFVSRWSKASGEKYGRGPGITMLPTIKTLNYAVQKRKEQWALAIQPPMKARERGVRGRIAQVPGYINYVQNMDDLQEMVTNARFDVASFSEEDLRGRIERGFFIDQVQLPPMEGTPASATEIAIRAEHMMRVLGPTYNRIEFEWMNPMLARHLNEMRRNGQLPEPPPALVAATRNADGSDGVVDIDFDFEGPLARAQAQSDIDAINRSLATLAPFEETHPETMYRINFEDLGEFVMQANRVPAPIIASDEEVNAKRDAATEQTEANQTTEEGLALSEGLKNVTPFLEANREGAL